jgi:hypothetical protein
MTKVYKLLHEYEHLVDMDFDATSEPFENKDTIGYDMMNIIPFDMPNKIYLRANFNVVPNNTDYPITDLTFPIFSKNVLDLLNRIQKIEIASFPTIMIDDKFSDDYLDQNRDVHSELNLDASFFAIQFLELSNVFDYTNSLFKPMRSNPELPGIIKKLVLKEPENGFPPLFKIEESLSSIFVSQEAKEALELHSIKGCIFEEIEVFEEIL